MYDRPVFLATLSPIALAGWFVTVALAFLLILQTRKRPVLTRATATPASGDINATLTIIVDARLRPAAVRDLSGAADRTLVLLTDDADGSPPATESVRVDQLPQLVERLDTAFIARIPGASRIDPLFVPSLLARAAEDDADAIAVYGARTGEGASALRRITEATEDFARVVTPFFPPRLRPPDAIIVRRESSSGAEAIETAALPAGARAHDLITTMLDPGASATAHEPLALRIAAAVWLVTLFLVPLVLLAATREFSWLIATLTGLWLRLRFDARLGRPIGEALVNPVAVAMAAVDLLARRR